MSNHDKKPVTTLRNWNNERKPSTHNDKRNPEQLGHERWYIILTRRFARRRHLVDSLEAFPADFEREVEGLKCEDGGWKLEEVEERNFGTIKVYTFTAV